MGYTCSMTTTKNTETAYRISQINAEVSSCTREVERRFTTVIGDAALDAKRLEWRRDMRAEPTWSSDFIRVREIG